MPKIKSKPLCYKPDYAVPPGKTLDERLEELGIIWRRAALYLRVSELRLYELIHGDVRITKRMMLKLEGLTGISFRVWDNLERDYRAALRRFAKVKDDKK